MRILLVLIVLISSFGLKGQRLDSVNTDSLKFVLEVIVNDIQTNKPIEGAEVWIVGTDNSSNKYITNKYGKIDKVNLKCNTSYSVLIKKSYYLSCKGKESTVGEKYSKHYIHEYKMVQGCINIIILYEQYYKHNEIIPYIASSEEDTVYKEVPANYYAKVMKENPTIIIQITGYQDEYEEEGISKERADIFVKELIKLGINEDRLIMVDGGIKVYKKYSHRKEEVSKQENRMINFKVLSTDFEAK